MNEITTEIITVQDLINALQTCEPTAFVLMFSDAEGNDIQPIDYIGSLDGASIAIVPKHRGWDLQPQKAAKP